MATRSTIAIELPSGKIKSVYCHWDGYLSYNGKILQEHYTTAEKVKKLISKGAISVLAPEIGRKHKFSDTDKGVCTFYARDRGEDKVVDKFKNLDDYIRNLDGQEYDYLFTKHGYWFVRSWRSDFFQLLDGQIAFATLHPDEYEHVTLEPLYAHPSKPTKPEARELYSFVEEYLEAWENGMAGDSYLFYLAQTALAKARGEA